MPTVIGHHDVKDKDHWLASPKREEFFGPRLESPTSEPSSIQRTQRAWQWSWTSPTWIRSRLQWRLRGRQRQWLTTAS